MSIQIKPKETHGKIEYDMYGEEVKNFLRANYYKNNFSL